MILTKDQATWLIGAIDLRLKAEGLAAATVAISITTIIQNGFNPKVEDEKEEK